MPKSKDKPKKNTTSKKPNDAIEFWGEDPSTPLISIEPNGDFYVRGKLKTSDVEVYKAINQLLKWMQK